MRLFRVFLSLVAIHAAALAATAQKAPGYDLFKIEKDELYWRYTYSYSGPADSVRRQVVQMLKSKFFTFNVIRNEMGYNGEIRHYKVDCKRYGRTYMNTPRMYTEGEWTGKFIVEVDDNGYRVIIFALYAEKIEKSTGYYKTEKITAGRYVDIVSRKDKSGFKKGELANVQLMSASLKDNFDIRNTVVP